MINSRLLVALVSLVSTLVVPIVCQGTQTPASDQTASALVTQLNQKSWMARADAYEQLRTNPSFLALGSVRMALLDLLDRENHLIEATLRESHENEGVSVKYGEAFSEYVDELGETVVSFADWSDPRQTCILVRRAYDPGSAFAAQIASHGRIAFRCLIEMFGSDVGPARAEAAPVIVQTLAKSKQQLDRLTVQAAQRVVRQALHDPNVSVRAETVEALSSFGTEDMISALKDVAKSDPAPAVVAMRKHALEAIANIEGRSRGK
jgi:hypothetical protein